MIHEDWNAAGGFAADGDGMSAGMSAASLKTALLLLGRVLLLVGLLLGLQQAELVKPLVSSGLAQGLVGGELGLVFGDFTRSFGGFDLNHRNDRLRRDLRSNFHFLLGGVSLVRLAQLLGEEDEFGAVLLETLHVLLQRLHALVTATVVNRDADRSGEILVEPGSLDLLQSETATETLFLVVLDGGASNDGPELGGGPGRDLDSLGLSGLGASDLPGRLIEPGLHAVLPILLEMGILNHVVMLRSHGYFFFPGLNP